MKKIKFPGTLKKAPRLFVEKDKMEGWHYKVAWTMVEFNVMVNMLSSKVTDNIF